MIGVYHISHVAALVGDAARSNMLFAMKSDGQISAGELARIASVSNSTASEHLAKLVDGGLVHFVKDGRQRYYELSSDTVAEILGDLESLAHASQAAAQEAPDWDEVHIHARKCMDHVAGRLGCGIAGTFIARGHVRLGRKGAQLTRDGERWLEAFGIDPGRLNTRRRLLSICPDWTENAPHLGGAVGAALMKAFVTRDWIRPDRSAGTTRITPKGAHGFRQTFGVDLRATV